MTEPRKTPAALVLPALLALIVPLAAACTETGGSGDGETVVIGTTDTLAAGNGTLAPLDPASAYDINSWNVLTNTMQGLLRLPRTGGEPEPDAARECRFVDKRSSQFRCWLRPGLEFSNGHELTAQDVKYSVDRVLRINAPQGPVGLLANIDTVETPSSQEVVFHLKSPDATFPLKLATPAAAIVDSAEYPKAKLREGFEVGGSGPYTVEVERRGSEAAKLVFTRNEGYEGSVEHRNDKVELRVFQDAGAMEKALDDGDIQVINRTLEPAQLAALRDGADPDLQFVETPSTGIRYLVFNMNLPVSEELGVRRAVAQLVDRKKLVRNVYRGAGSPLYSMIPRGVLGHSTAFFDAYGTPSVPKAAAFLADAGVKTPVPLTLDYTTDHYGAATEREFQELKAQLEASGLFDVTLRGTEWATFARGLRSDRYAVSGLGRFPDFPDAEAYVAPFVGPGNQNATGNHYRNTAIEERLGAGRQQSERDRVTSSFDRIQDILAQDVPVLPLWQGTDVIVAAPTVSGAEWALNSSSVLQMWQLRRGPHE
ncbi:putative D,D-dipeptide-binding periplasmic protein DdpA [Streptomyces sp. RB5]|uniref:Putative D,D-dipeptide-binding periplasmic protein DdpA n=1 Tax=Streptomyces smaragdinus TaxID=2585196 RepID=A0A7K0CKF6_9ACTN|nr:ABC transporter substrate-binding protein [Streptomyces smaragdinus]MQY13979.1 putative D,D-dipeptide-binding periplasmic protein DdpA [Streptomyces smaragdinus]